MIYRAFSARVFSLLFGITYAVVVHFDHPLFVYYPLINRWASRDLANPSLGPSMGYYGWIAAAAIVSLPITAVVPKTIGDRIPGAVYWLVPLVAFLAGYYHEQQWFH
jgi:hypothetical protein